MKAAGKPLAIIVVIYLYRIQMQNAARTEIAQVAKLNFDIP